MVPEFDKKKSVALMGAENSVELDNLDMGLQRTLLGLLSSLYTGGYRYFYTGLYEGFDLIAAEMVEMLKMRGGRDEARLVAVITTESQSSDYASENRAQFADLFARADHPYRIGQQFAGSKLAVEDEFIDKCDLIVCWDDGEDADLAFSLDKAREAGLQIMNVRDIHREE
jgi:uncharacterized phage-like protein YoqJ